MFQGPTQLTVRLKPPIAIGKQGLQRAVGIRPAQGLLFPKYLRRWQATPPPATVSQRGCLIIHCPIMCSWSFGEDATWRSCVATAYEDDVS